MAKYDDAIDNQWYYTKVRNNIMACCDCGLVHEIDVKIHKKKIIWRWRRNNKRTGQVRRWVPAEKLDSLFKKFISKFKI